MTLDTNAITLIFTIATFASVIIGSFITARQATLDRQEARRKESEESENERREKRLEYLKQRLTAVIALTGAIRDTGRLGDEKADQSWAEVTAIIQSLPYSETREFAKTAKENRYDNTHLSIRAVDNAIAFIGDQIWREINE